MNNDRHNTTDGNNTAFPHDADPYDTEYTNWQYPDLNAIAGEFTTASSHDGHYPAPPLALSTTSQGGHGEHQWTGSSAETTSWVDSQVPDAAFEPNSSSADTTPYTYQSEYFPSNNTITATYPSSFTSTSPWATTDSLSPTPSIHQQSQAWFTPPAGPSSGKPPPAKKKRGRPRLYEDDGTEVPKRPPGRPPVYNFASSSSGTSGSSGSSAKGSVTTTSTSIASSTSRPRLSNPLSNEDKDKQNSVRARNKAAATRYRQKTQAAITEMEEEERQASLRRQALIACVGKLREEVFQLKNEVLRHADCGCPLIEGYLSNAAQQAAMNLGTDAAGISTGMGVMSLVGAGDIADARVMHLEECSMVFGDGGYFEGGYVEGWQELGTEGVDEEGAEGNGAG